MANEIPIEDRPPPTDIPVPRYVVRLMFNPNPSPSSKKFVTLDANGSDYPPQSDFMQTRREGITRFHINLDGGLTFSDPYMRLLDSVPEEYRPYYFNLRRLSDTEIAFYAEYIPLLHDQPAFDHKCQFYIDDKGKPLRSKSGGPIDPDILNPGDHPPSDTTE